MPALNPRTDSFISMVLDTSGRVRAVDLQGIPEHEAAAALQEYAQAHPERGLRFDGHTLGAAVTVSAPAPTPAPAAVQPPLAGPGPAEDPAPVPVPAAVAAAAVSIPAPAPAPSPEALPGPAAPAPVGYGVPQPPSAGGYYGVADAAPPEYAAAAGGAWAASDSFTAPATPSAPLNASQEYEPIPPISLVPERKMAWWWWLLAWFFWPFGGIIGYFVVRGEDPKGARALMIFTVAVFVLSCLAGVLLGVLGGLVGLPVS